MFSRDIEVEHWLKIGQKAEGIKNPAAEGFIKKKLKNTSRAEHWQINSLAFPDHRLTKSRFLAEVTVTIEELTIVQ